VGEHAVQQARPGGIRGADPAVGGRHDEPWRRPEGTVEKHVRSILTNLDLLESATEHQRVLAVLTFLDAR
jgi:hypothetical protein